VVANDGWAAVVPFWAKWPFRDPGDPADAGQTLLDLGGSERTALADLLKAIDHALRQSVRDLVSVLDGVSPGAVRRRAAPRVALAPALLSPLLRSATVRKFMVGFEMLAMPGPR